jgi:hypothetical protein
MPRLVRVAAAQIGAVHVDSPREETLQRIIKLVEDAAAKGVKLVVLPETAFTTFFPRHVGLDKDPAELDKWYEEGDIATSKNVKPLFDRARELDVSICVGYAEKTNSGERYNTCSYVHNGTELGELSTSAFFLGLFLTSPLCVLKPNTEKFTSREHSSPSRTQMPSTSLKNVTSFPVTSATRSVFFLEHFGQQS